MARRRKKKKRLNRRVVIVLAILGLGLVVAAGLSSQRVRDWLFPPDPASLATKAASHVKTAQDLVAQGKYAEAHEAYDRADFFHQQAIYHSSGEYAKKAEYCYTRGKTLLDQYWVKEGLSETRRTQLRGAGLGSLAEALRQDGRHVKSQKLRCETLWRLGYLLDYIEEAGKLLKMDKADHVTWSRRGRARARLVKIDNDKADEALADLQQAIDLKPDNVDYWIAKAAFEEKIKRFEPAAKTYETALNVEANANSSQLRVTYAWYLYQRNFRQEARAQIDQAVARAPEGDTLGLRALATLLKRDRRPAEALDVLERARKIDPDDYWIYSELASAHRMLKNVPEAAKVLRTGIAKLADKVAEAPPSTPKERRTLDGARVKLNHDLARMVIILAGEVTDKAKRAEMLVEASNCAEVIRGIKGQEHFADGLAGQIAYYQGKRSEALKLLEEAHERFGYRLDPITASLLMRLYRQIGAPGKAEAILDRFLGSPAHRHNTGIRLEKARILMGYGRWAEAERFVRDALRIDSQSKDAKELLAVIALQTRQPVRALPDTKLTPRIIGAALTRAASLWADGQRPQAIQLAEALFERVPANLRVVQQLISMYKLDKKDTRLNALLARLKAEQPKLAEQVRYYQDLLAEKDPAKRLAMQVERAAKIKDPLRRELALADLYRMAGQTETFLEHLDRAGKIKPDSADVIVHRLNHAIAIEDWRLAETVVAQGAKANVDRAGGKLLKAQLAVVRGRDDVAARTYTEVLAVDANNIQARLARGRIYLRQGKLSEAADDFQTVAGSNPGNAQATIGMMLVSERQGKQAELDDWLDRAHKLAPGHPDVARRFTNREELRASRPEEIIAKRQKQLARDPRDLHNRLRLGALYEQTGKLDEAEKMFISVRDLAADKLLGTQHLARFYARTNRLGQADELIRALQKTTDNKVGAYILYGEFLTPYKPDQAQRAFASAIRADPDNPAGHLALARFHAARRRWDDAVNAMTRCVELRKDSSGAEKELIGYQINAGKYADAESRLKGILKASPKDAAALRLRASLRLRRDDDVTGAEGLLTEAIRQNPRDVGSLLARARLYLAIRDLPKARDDYEKASQIVPSAQTVLELADVYRRLKQYRQAEEALAGLLKRMPGMVQVVEQLAVIYSTQERWRTLEQLLAHARAARPSEPRFRIIEALMWRRRADHGKELQALASAVQVAPENVTAVGAYLDGLLRTKQYAKIIEVGAHYADRKGMAYMATATRARALAETGKVAEAEATFRDLLKKAPVQNLDVIVGHLVPSFGLDKTIARLPEWRGRRDEWQLHSLLSQLHGRAGQTPEVIKALLKARELSPEESPHRGRLNVQLGITFQGLGRTQEAEEAYLAALTLLPNDPEVLNNLAFLYADELNNPSKALPYALKAYRWASTHPSVADTYAWVLAKLKRYPEAQKILETIAREENTVPAIRYHLGWVYEQQDKLSQAERQYNLGREMTAGRAADKVLHEKLVQSIKRVQGKRNR